MDATFTKSERLCSVKEITALVKSGKVLFHYPFRVVFTPNGAECNRVVVSVPKKNFKRAVKRNLLKRRTRESYRKNKELLTSTEKLNVMFVYISKDILEYSYIESRTREILAKISEQAPQIG